MAQATGYVWPRARLEINDEICVDVLQESMKLLPPNRHAGESFSAFSVLPLFKGSLSISLVHGASLMTNLVTLIQILSILSDL